MFRRNTGCKARLFRHLSSLFLMGVVMMTITLDSQAALPQSRFSTLFQALDLTNPALQPVATALNAGDEAQAVRLLDAYLHTRTNVRYFFSPRDRGDLIGLIRDYYGGAMEERKRANLYVRNRFSILGVDKQLSSNIEWKQGPNEWTNTFNRHRFWWDMGIAYWDTRDETYAKRWVEQLRDWIQDNPVPTRVNNGFGTNGNVWRTLEAGIRIDAWLRTYQYFITSDTFDAETHLMFIQSLYEHARYLANYEKVSGFLPGNWQVSELTGLVLMGAYFPEFREAQNWLDLSLTLVERHINETIRPDGGYVEVTPGYHAGVIDRFLKIFRILEINGQEIAPKLWARYESMFSWLATVTRPNGTWPALGDTRATSAAEYLTVGAVLFNRPDFRYLSGQLLSKDMLWVLGVDGFNKLAFMKPTPPQMGSVHLANSGLSIIRNGWSGQSQVGLFDLTPNFGAHYHPNRLAFSLYAYGEDLLADPGNQSYDSPYSQSYFKQAEAHNILYIDGTPLTGEPTHTRWDDTATFTLTQGQVTGQVSGTSITQTRTVVFVKSGYWLVLDDVTGAGSHTIEQLWHLSFGPVTLSPTGTSMAATTTGVGPTVRMVASAAEGEVTGVQTSGYIPTGDSTVREAPVVHIRTEGKDRLLLLTVTEPVKPKAEPTLVQLERVGDQGGAPVWSVLWRTGGVERRDTVRYNLNDKMLQVL